MPNAFMHVFFKLHTCEVTSWMIEPKHTSGYWSFFFCDGVHFTLHVVHDGKRRKMFVEHVQGK